MLHYTNEYVPTTKIHESISFISFIYVNCLSNFYFATNIIVLLEISG